MLCDKLSSLTKKYLVALTGLMLVGFLVAHLLGNLKVFAGPQAINDYAKFLESLGLLLWIPRLTLLVAFVVHIKLAITLAKENTLARPVGYGLLNTQKATFASRHMVLTGLLVLAYVIFHLAHFTWKLTHPEFSGFHGDVYKMIILSFHSTPLFLTYVFFLLVLGLHLWHGASSVFQTLGFNTPRQQKWTKWIGPTLALILALGYLSIPIAVRLGCLN